MDSFFKKIRYLFRLYVAYIERYALYFIYSLFGALFIGIALINRNWVIERIPVTEKIGIVGSYNLTSLPPEIEKKISLGLTDVATLTATEEGKKYTAVINKDYYWHDKIKLTAHDINYNFKDVTIAIRDDKTVIFTLKNPYSPFPSLLSKPLFKKKLVGLGEYKVLSYKIKQGMLESITITKNNHSGRQINEFYRFYHTEEIAKLAFKLGEVNILQNINSVDGLSGNNLQISKKTNFNQLVGLFFNVNASSVSEKKIRQGIAYAVPDLFSDQTPALSVISPLSWAYNSDVKPYVQDLENAKKLLANSKPFTIATPSQYFKEAEIIAAELKKLGVIVNIKPEDYLPLTFQILLTAQNIPDDPDQYFLWHSTQKTTNITGYNSKKVDKLLEDGRRLTKRADRLSSYLEFQKVISEDVPVIPLYYPYVYTVKR